MHRLQLCVTGLAEGQVKRVDRIEEKGRRWRRGSGTKALSSSAAGSRKGPVHATCRPLVSILIMPRNSPTFNIRMASSKMKIPTHTPRDSDARWSPRIFPFQHAAGHSEKHFLPGHDN